MPNNSYLTTGLAALILALFLFLVAIPYGVTEPSNVTKIVLSPVFWPEVLSILLGITGIGLIFSASSTSEDESIGQDPASKGSYTRLLFLAVLMGVYIFAIPKLGLVWTSMIAFIGLAVLIKCSHPRIAVISAIIIPLILYLFFVHVAGMAIPQGDFLRLP
jgi:putative tricarboxylic transport membrane protein